MTWNRRTFLRTAAAGMAAAAQPSLARLFAAGPDVFPGDLFESPDPAVLKLAAEVYQKWLFRF